MARSGGPKICVLIPAYRCERTIEDVVRGALESGLPVVVVDDGSGDRTFALAHRAGARVLCHDKNQGKGAALATGFQWAREYGFDAVITMDADGQHDPADIGGFVEAFRPDADEIILGSRMSDAASMRPLNRFLNRVGVKILSRVLDQPVADSQTGYRLYPLRLFDLVQLTGVRFDAENEILVKASRLGWQFRSVTVRTIYHPHHTSHLRPFLDTLRIARTVVKSLVWRPR